MLELLSIKQDREGVAVKMDDARKAHELAAKSSGVCCFRPNSPSSANTNCNHRSSSRCPKPSKTSLAPSSVGKHDDQRTERPEWTVLRH